MNNKKPTQILDKGQLINEKTEGFGLMSFVYTHKLGNYIRPILTKKFISSMYGAYQNSIFSKHLITPFVHKHHINMEEFEQPKKGYRSFNDFFIRKLKPGIRSIDQSPKKLISPADSKLFVIPKLTQNSTFFVKQLPFNLETFLCDQKLANEYEHGTMLIFRLAPYDYHRFHFPAAGTPETPAVIKGKLDSVNPLVYKAGFQPLLSNERHIITLQTQDFDTILMVPVGAMLVGKIVETYTPQKAVNKGDEAGYFAFGGSTVVLLFRHGAIKIKEDFIQNSSQGFETVVKMGEVISS